MNFDLAKANTIFGVVRIFSSEIMIGISDIVLYVSSFLLIYLITKFYENKEFNKFVD